MVLSRLSRTKTTPIPPFTRSRRQTVENTGSQVVQSVARIVVQTRFGAALVVIARAGSSTRSDSAAYLLEVQGRKHETAADGAVRCAAEMWSRAQSPAEKQAMRLRARKTKRSPSHLAVLLLELALVRLADEVLLPGHVIPGADLAHSAVEEARRSWRLQRDTARRGEATGRRSGRQLGRRGGGGLHKWRPRRRGEAEASTRWR